MSKLQGLAPWRKSVASVAPSLAVARLAALGEPVAYCDSVEIFVRRLTFHAELQRLHGRAVRPRRVHDRSGQLQGFRLPFNLPAPPLLDLLDALDADRKASVGRCDLGFDWLGQTQAEADAIAADIRRTLVLRRRRRRDVMRRVEGTTDYWTAADASRGLALYPDRSDRRSRTPAAPGPACHLELRIKTARAVHAARTLGGQRLPVALRDLDPIAILNHVAGRLPHDADAVQARMLVHAEAAQAAYRAGPSFGRLPAFDRLYLDGLPRLTQHMIDALALDTAQGWRDAHPNQRRRDRLLPW